MKNPGFELKSRLFSANITCQSQIVNNSGLSCGEKKQN